ncbi:hypothetical protein H6P81_019104 [Aristolochia fimbriata]|uniref:Uncharacterized protein n=1 Tax=Aristolochia fimbriata TaxID=158543 RepID=A0AAV7DSG2_ARIFI|nr:hypothetical protein H6P81_019104 [Aristolochia fimbriata]
MCPRTSKAEERASGFNCGAGRGRGDFRFVTRATAWFVRVAPVTAFRAGRIKVRNASPVAKRKGFRTSSGRASLCFTDQPLEFIICHALTAALRLVPASRPSDRDPTSSNNLLKDPVWASLIESGIRWSAEDVGIGRVSD